ncbi:hypothetical protein GBAR_LOCUS8514 [Geodia barretti]|uniref:TM2 domain-containing protein n=1 Tax=Geodia barretti TaxID=519541 RepID=A0AA35RKX0_GEOBA|nr:hypothetical protein GBAR_LOCUS8514 [Geodia barretti]
MGPEGTCIEVSCEDWRYNTRDLDCQDDRPSQLTAFLLSFFLSSTGAANFYIGRDDLGGGQLFLLILMFAVSYITCYLPCCLGCCMSKDDVKGSIFFMALIVLETVLVVIIFVAIWAWWLADLIIFATNQRDAGNGCMLRENL